MVDTDNVTPLVYIGRSTAQIEALYGDRLSRLQAEGFNIHILAGPDGGTIPLRDRGFEVKPIPVANRWNLAGLVGAFFIIQGHLLEVEPIVVHSRNDLLAWLGSLAARRAGVPAIFSIIDQDIFTPNPVPVELDRFLDLSPTISRSLEDRVNDIAAAPVTNTFVRLYAQLGGIVDKYVVTTRYDLEIIEQTELIEPSKLEIVLGGKGIDFNEFNPDADEAPSKEEARQKLLNEEHRKRQLIGYRGESLARAGMPELREIIERIHRSNPSVGWLIQPVDNDRGDDFEELRALDDRYNIEFIDPAVDPSLFFTTLDVYVDPSRETSHAPNLMKAAAMKVPQVAFNFPAQASVIQEDQTGRLVPPGEMETFIEHLEELLNNPKKRRNLGIRARGRAAQHFDRRYIDQQVIRLYDQTLEAKMT